MFYDFKERLEKQKIQVLIVWALVLRREYLFIISFVIIYILSQNTYRISSLREAIIHLTSSLSFFILFDIKAMISKEVSGQ